MYKKLETTKIVTFDVDDTLVTWSGTSYKAHALHVEALKRHAVRGHYVIVWSAGGADWAEVVVNILGLGPFVNMVMDKPSWYVDDKPADAWMDRYFIEEGSETCLTNLKRS